MYRYVHACLRHKAQYTNQFTKSYSKKTCLHISLCVVFTTSLFHALPSLIMSVCSAFCPAGDDVKLSNTAVRLGTSLRQHPYLTLRLDSKNET